MSSSLGTVLLTPPGGCRRWPRCRARTGRCSRSHCPPGWTRGTCRHLHTCVILCLVVHKALHLRVIVMRYTRVISYLVVHRGLHTCRCIVPPAVSGTPRTFSTDPYLLVRTLDNRFHCNKNKCNINISQCPEFYIIAIHTSYMKLLWSIFESNMMYYEENFHIFFQKMK